jgi:hypothetical protein
MACGEPYHSSGVIGHFSKMATYDKNLEMIQPLVQELSLLGLI